MGLLLIWFSGYILSYIIILFIALLEDGKINKQTIMNGLGFAFFSWFMVAISLLILIVSLITYEKKE